MRSGSLFTCEIHNGASLGFNFNNEKLIEMNSSESKLNKYVRNTRVKAGLFENSKVKGQDLLMYIGNHYPEELGNSIKKIQNFNLEEYDDYIRSIKLLSVEQKKWLIRIISARKEKILEWVREKEDYND